MWFCVYRKVIRDSSDSDITSMLVQGGALWLGTRDGYILFLDSYTMMDGKEPLLGLQQCGHGKVKCIVPLARSGSKLQARYGVIWVVGGYRTSLLAFLADSA